MPFDWDDTKRRSNLAKHGVDFASVEFFEWETATIGSSLGRPEPRLIAVGLIGGRLHVVVFSIETRVVRIISLRRANSREIRQWQSQT